MRCCIRLLSVGSKTCLMFSKRLIAYFRMISGLAIVSRFEAEPLAYGELGSLALSISSWLLFLATKVGSSVLDSSHTARTAPGAIF